MNEFLIEIRDVSKTFFGIQALHNIQLGIRRGQVLGLIGQNGAGKSTLMNILGGVIQPDSGGRMVFNAETYQPRSPSDATHHGIAFIHQELNLFTNLNIAENIFIDEFPTFNLGIGGLRFVDRRKMYEATRTLLDSIDLDLSPRMLIDDLSPGERQLVEIAKALHIDAELIIFDEPTTSLTAKETEQLFNIIHRLRENGKTIIYISHILADVLKIADDIAVLRDGELVGAGAVQDFNINRMISMMIGRDLDQLFPVRETQPASEVVLEVRKLCQSGIVKDINLTLHKGEVLGVFGLMGSGRTELARILFGLDDYESGEVVINGAAEKHWSPAKRIANRVAFVTENRREEGLMMEATIADNIGLASLNRWARMQFLDRQTLLTQAQQTTQMLHIKCGDIYTQPAKSLSGGNQQKVVIAKWLMSEPMIFMMDEPTRGIDVGAKFEIYTIMNQLAAQGSSILFISSDLDELIGMCDRIVVMGRGEICGEFVGRTYGKESILRAAFREGETA